MGEVGAKFGGSRKKSLTDLEPTWGRRLAVGFLFLSFPEFFSFILAVIVGTRVLVILTHGG